MKKIGIRCGQRSVASALVVVGSCWGSWALAEEHTDSAPSHLEAGEHAPSDSGEDSAEEQAEEKEIAPADEMEDFHGKSHFTEATWPTELIQRPLTLAQGMVELRGGASIVASSGSNLGGGLGVGVGYGLADKLELDAALTAGIFPTLGFGEASVGARYLWIATHHVELGPVVKLAWSASGGRVEVGAATKLELSHHLFIEAGDGLLGLAFSPVGLAIDLNVALGLQATRHLAFTLSTQLFHVDATSPRNSSLIGLNTLPVGLGAFWGLNHRVDLGATFQWLDLRTDPTAFAASVFANVRL